MDTGMLWFDDGPGALSDRVRRAVEYYAQKFGRSPTLCLVNPAMLEKDSAVAGIQLRAARTVMVNHFFIGEERHGRPNGDGPTNGKAKPGERADAGRAAQRSAKRGAKRAKGSKRPAGKSSRQGQDGSARG